MLLKSFKALCNDSSLLPYHKLDSRLFCIDFLLTKWIFGGYFGRPRPIKAFKPDSSGFFVFRQVMETVALVSFCFRHKVYLSTTTEQLSTTDRRESQCSTIKDILENVIQVGETTLSMFINHVGKSKENYFRNGHCCRSATMISSHCYFCYHKERYNCSHFNCSAPIDTEGNYSI